MTTLFIADLHLSSGRPAINAQFFAFLAGPAREAEALYILGDLFEYWAGDDDIDDPFNRSVVQALRALADAGVAVSLLRGNRDFLLGAEFARQAGATLLDDAVLIDLDGTPTLVMHGDTLCTDDHAYLEFRETVRHPQWIAKFLGQPLALRKAHIENLRQHSEQEKQRKSMDIMDANPAAVADVLRAHGYPRLIHGHTHRPARHTHVVDGRPCERWVLADWYERGSYLLCDAAGVRSITL